MVKAVKSMGHTYKAQVHASSRGFQYTLENGYRLSLMFGVGNYCDNRSWNYSPNYITDSDGVISCDNFEVAVFTPDDTFLDLVDEVDDEDGTRRVEQVIGWVPAWTLPNLIQRIKYFPEYRLNLHDELRVYALAFGKFCEKAKDGQDPRTITDI